jgi:hypothetical protein
MVFCIGFEGFRVAYLAEEFELLLIKDMKMRGCACLDGNPFLPAFEAKKDWRRAAVLCLLMVSAYNPKPFLQIK